MPLDRLGWTPERERELDALGRPHLRPFRVSTAHRGGGLELLGEDGPIEGRIPGRLRHRAASPAELPATGDWVAADPRSGIVEAVLERRGGIARASAQGRSEAHVLAANVDVALVMGSLNRDLNIRRLERFLGLAADAEAEPVVVLSKSDLDPDPSARAREVDDALGHTVPVLTLSARTGEGLDRLDPWLRPGRTIVLLGSSGVGKTTLLNALTGTERPTAPVRGSDDRGRHTTVRRELIPLPSGALAIDTPGLRLPRLWEQAEGLRSAFADVEELARQCRFPDCRHTGEPGCAVAAAVADGRLPAARLAGLVKLEGEQATITARREARERSERKRTDKAAERALRRRAEDDAPDEE